MKNKYIIFIEGLGIGKAPDSRGLKSEGANTLKMLNDTKSLKINNLKSLGFGLIKGVDDIGYELFPKGRYGRAFSEIKSKNTNVLIQEILQINKDKLPKYNPMGPLSPKLLDIVRSKTGYSFLGNKKGITREIVSSVYDKHVKTGKFILTTTGNSDLILAGDESVINYCEMLSLFDKLVNIVSSCKEFAFSEYKLMIFNKVPDANKFMLNPSKSKTINIVFDNNYLDKNNVFFVGKNFDDIIDKSFSVLKTSSDLITYQWIINEIKENKSKNKLYFVKFTQLYENLIKKRIPGALSAINSIDLFIGEIVKNLNDTDEILVIGVGGADINILKEESTKEAIPYIFYSNNCPPKNLGDTVSSNILNIL